MRGRRSRYGRKRCCDVWLWRAGRRRPRLARSSSTPGAALATFAELKSSLPAWRLGAARFLLWWRALPVATCFESEQAARTPSPAGCLCQGKGHTWHCGTVGNVQGCCIRWQSARDLLALLSRAGRGLAQPYSAFLQRAGSRQACWRAGLDGGQDICRCTLAACTRREAGYFPQADLHRQLPVRQISTFGTWVPRKHWCHGGRAAEAAHAKGRKCFGHFTCPGIVAASLRESIMISSACCPRGSQL